MQAIVRITYYHLVLRQTAYGGTGSQVEALERSNTRSPIDEQ